jgi:uncharacterized protein (TIGR01777 family)
MVLLVTGGTGFIGRELLKSMRANSIILLTRETERAKKTLKHVDHGQIDYITSLDALDTLDHVDAVINLAGEPIADKRWSKSQKKIICDSRWSVTQQIVDLIAASQTPPHTFISGSAVGYYGDQDQHSLDESFELTESLKEHFSHQVCQRWEEIAVQAHSEQTRVCIVRTGVVLGKEGGALPKMSLPFQYGVGGKIGSGQQYLPWIHLHDMVQGLLFLLNTPTAHGAFNFNAPHPVSNAKFSQLLARQLKRPNLFFVPAWAMKLIMGESSSLVLDSCRTRPKRLTELGFNFTYSRLEPALKQIYSS